MMNDCSSHTKRPPVTPNLLAFYLIVLITPFEYILDILGGPFPASLLARILATCAVAIVITYLGAEKPRTIGHLGIRVWAVVWLVLCAAVILTLAAARGQLQSLHSASPSELIFIISLSVLMKIIWRAFPNFQNFLAYVGTIAFPIGFVAIPFDLITQAIHHLPNVYDPVLYRIDALLMLSSATLLPWLVGQHPLIQNALVFIYNYTLLWMQAAAILQCFYTPARRNYMVLCSFLVGVLGFGLYYLMPAVAPSFFFGTLYPLHLPPAQELPTHEVLSPIASFRNTMPSLHTASALLIILALRDSPIWQRIPGIFIAIGIIISTLALGEHYAVDLIAAFPLVLLVRGLGAICLPLNDRSRYRAILAGGLLTFLWILTVRGAPLSLQMPDLIRLLAVASLVISGLLEHQLTTAEILSDHPIMPASAAF